MSEQSLLAGRYHVVRFLGKGGFGIVEACTDTLQGNAYVAIKTIPARCVNRESKRLLREVDIMIQLANKHPHLMSVLDVFVTPAADLGDDVDAPNSLALTVDAAEVTPDCDFNVHMVMPMMKSDLHAFTRHPPRGLDSTFISTVSVVFAFQIAFGLDYLHQSGIVHRDIKTDNILIRLDVTNAYASTAVIADFGLARDASQTDTFYICTRHYRPPEVVTNTSRGDASIDIWSLGCIYYEMVTGQTLFTLPSALNAEGQWVGVRASEQLEVILNIVGLPSAEEIRQLVPPGNVQSYLLKSRPRPSRVEELIRSRWRLDGAAHEEIDLWVDLIKRCVDFFPDRRPTAGELCSHPLFKRYEVHYGDNVKQYPVVPYQPVVVSEAHGVLGTRENKEAVIEAVNRLHAAIEDAAVHSEGEAPPRLVQERAGHAFPVIKNDTLRNKYAMLPTGTIDEVQQAQEEVLGDLELFTHDPATSAELHKLLNYFMGLNVGPPAVLEADDVAPSDNVQPMICDDDDDDGW